MQQVEASLEFDERGLGRYHHFSHRVEYQHYLRRRLGRLSGVSSLDPNKPTPSLMEIEVDRNQTSNSLPLVGILQSEIS
jgi:hypothetical protein